MPPDEQLRGHHVVLHIDSAGDAREIPGAAYERVLAAPEDLGAVGRAYLPSNR